MFITCSYTAKEALKSLSPSAVLEEACLDFPDIPLSQLEGMLAWGREVHQMVAEKVELKSKPIKEKLSAEMAKVAGDTEAAKKSRAKLAASAKAQVDRLKREVQAAVRDQWDKEITSLSSLKECFQGIALTQAEAKLPMWYMDLQRKEGKTCSADEIVEVIANRLVI